MLSFQNIKSVFTRLKVNEDGNMAIMMAVAGLTLATATGLALDVMGAQSSKQKLQDQLDGISLAIATSGIANADEQKALAQDLLAANEYNIDPANLTIQTAPNGEIHVTGQTVYHLALGGLFNKETCLLYTSPSPRDQRGSRMPSSA